MMISVFVAISMHEDQVLHWLEAFPSTKKVEAWASWCSMYVPKFKVHSGQFFEKMTYFAIFLNIAQCSILWEISDLTILHKDHVLHWMEASSSTKKVEAWALWCSMYVTKFKVHSGRFCRKSFFFEVRFANILSEVQVLNSLEAFPLRKGFVSRWLAITMFNVFTKVKVHSGQFFWWNKWFSLRKSCAWIS